MSKIDYGTESIKSLGLVEGIKLRPSTFIDGLGQRGIMKLILEMIQNSQDEISVGASNRIVVKIDSKTPEITVQDFGRGIPFDNKDDNGATIKRIMEEIYSGGKFDSDSYGVAHSGQNGMGLMVTQVLSDYLDMEVKRDKLVAKVRYESGYNKKLEISEDPDQTYTGTKITFKPTLEIFFGGNTGFPMDGNWIDKKTLLEILEMMSFLNPGVEIDVQYDTEKYKYYFIGTINDYLDLQMKRSKIKPLIDSIFTFEVKDPNTLMFGKVAISFGKNIGSEKFWSYVNRFPTAQDGKHVDGVRSSISRVITMALRNGNYVPKSAKYTASGADVTDSLVGVVLAELDNPLFDGQTKNKLTSEDYFNFMTQQTYRAFSQWASDNPMEMDIICKLAAAKAKANFAAKEARQAALDPSSLKNKFQSKVDLRKFTDCSGSNPEENELFLLEGDSAGGSASQARDSKTQAFLRLRGKVLNVVGRRTGQLSEELEAIITILGIGSGNKINYSRLKYHKIIIMTDADPDGGHITALLLAFFISYYPELIREGHIYVATPPLYQLILNKKTSLNILNEEYFKIYKKTIALKNFDLLDENEKPIDNKNLFKFYIHFLLGFTEYMDDMAKVLNLDPILLELIVRNFDNLCTNKYDQFEFFGYDIKLKKKTNSSLTFDIDKGFDHYYLKIDNAFYRDFYIPIYKRMCEFKLSNVKLKSLKTNKIYGGTSYQLCTVLNSTMEGRGVELKRFKGLGEMNPELLKETAMDPSTRKIVRVTMEDAEAALLTTEVFLGKSQMETKKAFFSTT